MEQDIDFIRQLERETGNALKHDNFAELLNSKQNGYTSAELGAVTGLCLFKISLASLSGTILRFKHLQRLVLSEVEVKAKDFPTLRQMPSLTLLDLSGNKAGDISFLSGLKQITQLYLGGNDIKDISPLRNLVHLSALDLQDNRLTNVQPLEKLRSLKIVNLQNNQISDISPLRGLNGIVYLNVSGNRVPGISPIQGLGKLAYLDAAHNQIDQISTLSGLPGLTYLNLAGNKIKDLSPIRGLTGLTNLNLAHNRINSIFSIKELRNLTDLDLGGNEISDISSLINLHALTKLVLNGNRISDLQPLSHMRALNELNLGFNQISDLSPLQGLNALTGLYLSFNKISDLSPLQELDALSYLDLGSNQISELSTLKELSALKKLYLFSNRISDLSPLQTLDALDHLDIGSNQISDLSPLQLLNAFSYLDLSSNQISDLSPLQGLNSLTFLSLSFNQISDLSPLQRLNFLTFLSLSSNQISDLSPLQSLNALFFLSLSSNQISDLSPLLELKNLHQLDLRNNHISQLPREILDFNLDIRWGYKPLENSIFLEGNPLETPPLEIVKQGNAAVRNYFRELGAAQVYLLESRLLIVGNGEVGKTTLMRKLKDNTFQMEVGKEPTTHGIGIEPWEMECDFDSGQGPRVEKVTLHAWDFGGQDIYHATHQFFLTKRSLYLLVWEARKEDETFSFDYWLNIIRLLGADSPVIVVMNKVDVRSKAVDEATYQEKFDNISGFLQVSCLTGEGIEKLTGQIRTCLNHMPHLQDKLPNVWKQIRDRLKQVEKNYIPLLDYLAICREYGLDEARAEFLSGYLHDLGAILHFRGDPLLENTVILKPGWATTAVYNLVDTREILENKGRFNTPDLRKYWDPTLFPRELHPQLLRLLEKFELCFPVTGTDIHIVPELLRAQRPPLAADKYKTPGSLHLQIHYEFMPAGLITRFISRMYYLIKNDHYWKTGVELHLEDTYALVAAELPNRRIKIAVTGPGQRELLAIARNDFHHIHRTLSMEKNRHYKEMLPCTCSKCKDAAEPRLYEYDVLKDFAAKGNRYIPCFASVEDVEIETLLNGYEAEQPRQDLLKTLIGAASQLQGLAASLQPDENSRNSFIALLLSIRGFNVKDQTRWGYSASGKSIGIPDIKIETTDNEAEALIEAFNLEGYNRTVIDSHLTKLFGYDPHGLARNFILVYVRAADFSGLWQRYLDHLPEIDFEYKLLEKKPGSKSPLEEEPTGYTGIKLARARHAREGEITEVCHLFIKMEKST